MMFKKQLISGFLALSCLLFPAVSFGSTIGESNNIESVSLQAQIAQLTAQINALKAQLAQQTGNATICFTFSRSLGVGVELREAEASALKADLVKEGVWDVANELMSFDEDVASAVIDFQTKYGISKTGFLGPKTRAKLNALYGCNNIGTISPQPVYVVSLKSSPIPTSSGIVGNSLNYTVTSNQTFDKVIFRADCYANEIGVSAKGGMDCGENNGIGFSPTTSYSYPVTFSSKDGNSHVVVMTALLYSNGVYLGSSRDAVTITGTGVVGQTSTASIVGSPTLDMAYDSANKEVLLSARFLVAVNGGSQGLNISSYINNIRFLKSGQPIYVNSQRGTITSTDSNYSSVIFVPAGQARQFQVVSTVNPKELFAGVYTANLSALYTSDSQPIPITQNLTNEKVVIGETSPYISNVNFSNGTVMISGARLNANDTAMNVYLDMKQLTNITLAGAQDGTLLSFIAPNVLTAGSHAVQLRSEKSGDSNVVWFSVAGSPVQNNTQTYVPVTSSTQSYVSVASVTTDSTHTDHAGVWHGFSADGQPDNNWTVNLTVNNSNGGLKTVSSISLLSDRGGEGWSTNLDTTDLGKGLYPLVVFRNGVQLNTDYNQSIVTFPNDGSYILKLYGQGNGIFSGGKLIVRFSDGTSVTSIVPSGF